DRLAAGGTGRQAVEIGALQVEVVGDVPGGGVHFLFVFALRVKFLQATEDKVTHIHTPTIGTGAAPNQGDQVVEILHTFAGTQVNTEAGMVHFVVIEQTGFSDSLLGSAQREAGVGAAVFPAVLTQVFLQAKVLDLRSELGRKTAGVKKLDGTNAAFAFNLRLV